MRAVTRKSAPEVRNGRVQKKNNWEETPNYYDTELEMPVIDRKRPGEGYRHFLKRRDIERFVGILPDWRELSQGLNAIVLAPGDATTYGYHLPGVVHVCAWPSEGTLNLQRKYFEQDRDIVERLGVEWRPLGQGMVRCLFTEDTIRAFLLLRVLLHELGHHHDRMTTRLKEDSSRGEAYAEAYARQHEQMIWDRYVETFRLGR